MIIALWIALIICVVWIALGEMPAVLFDQVDGLIFRIESVKIADDFLISDAFH